MASCNSCGAAIVWAQTEKGKSIPLDAEPVEGGNIWLYCGVARVGDTPPALGVVDRYVSHFATCPNANKHRRRRA